MKHRQYGVTFLGISLLGAVLSTMFWGAKASAIVEDPGYFTGDTIILPSSFLYEHDVLDARSRGLSQSIPATVYDGVGNDKQDFINWVDGLVQQDSKANTWNELGGAFIVNTMTRQTAPSMTVTSAMFQDFVNRVNNPNIIMRDDYADPNSYCPSTLNGGYGCKVSFYGGSAGFDDLYATYKSATLARMLIFTDPSGKVLYVLEVPCANPVGDLPGIPSYNPDTPPSNSFTVSCTTLQGTATDSDRPGQSLVVAVLMDGVPLIDTVTKTAVILRTDASGGYNYPITTYVQLGSHSFTTIAYGLTPTGTNGSDTTSGPKAVGPCNNGSCKQDTFPDTMLVGSPQQFTVSFNLGAWGPPLTTSDPALSVQVRDPGGNPVVLTPAGTNAGYAVTGTLNGGVYSPAVLTSPSFSFTPSVPGRYQMQYSLVGAGLDIHCPGGNSGNWDPPTSGDAGYRPYFNVTGGDILSQADIRSWNRDAATPFAAGDYTGAGTSLAALASGDIKNFVTGTGMTGGAAAEQGTGLGFANTTAIPGNGLYGGGYTVGGFTPTYRTQTNTLSGTVNVAGLSDGVYYAASSISLFGSLRTGVQATIIVANSFNATIIGTGIAYDAYGSSLNDIPRLTLLVKSGNIFVNKSVTAMRGVYYAGGSGARGNFYTCTNGSTPINLSSATGYTDCKNKLTVYGSVAAEELILGRTYGSIMPAAGVALDSAEEFYYSPELWLAPASSTISIPSDTWDSYVSLPPVL